MKHGATLLTLLALTLLTTAAVAETTGWINGECAVLARESSQVWRYALTMSWSNPKHALSHMDVILDDGNNCTAAQLLEGLNFESPGASGTGEPVCVLDYDVMVESSDPSIRLSAVLLKLEPVSGDCEPGTSGTVTVEFRSSYPPAAIQAENLFLVEKFSTDYITGELTGMFPAFPCNPVDAESVTWSTLKT
ncbi:hypothetical protein KDK88_07370, partial [bacterium]|nr:hypothetical protein [bacterium]